MKKLILTTVLLLTILTLQAQQQFEGMWTCEESSYTTVILADEHKIIKVIGFSFDEKEVLEEKIISKDTDSFTTSIHIKENGWKVKIVYEYISKDTLYCHFTGDYTGLVIMTRLKQID